MKVLQLSHKPPFPPVDGGSIAINNISIGLSELGVDLKLISINTPKHFVNKKDLPKDYLKITKAELVYVDTDVKPLNAIFNLFSKRSYHLTRFYSDKLEKKIIEELKKEDYDYVLFESIYLSDYVKKIKKFTKAKMVLRSHNIEFLIWKRIADQEKNPFKKEYLKLLSKRLEREEKERIFDYDAIVCVSEKDQVFFEQVGYSKPICSIPIAMDVTKPDIPSTDASEFPGLFMLGALDWIPNQEGIYWLLKHVWPDLIALYPDLTLKIAGRRPSQQILDIKENGVEIIGEIESASRFLNENSIMLVPLFSGSGIRVKIIEGMMMGKVIVTTPIGAEGIPCQSEENILIAKDASEFKDCIVRLINDRSLSNKLSVNARNFARKHYSNEQLNMQLIRFLSTI